MMTNFILKFKFFSICFLLCMAATDLFVFQHLNIIRTSVPQLWFVQDKSHVTQVRLPSPWILFVPFSASSAACPLLFGITGTMCEPKKCWAKWVRTYFPLIYMPLSMPCSILSTFLAGTELWSLLQAGLSPDLPGPFPKKSPFTQLVLVLHRFSQIQGLTLVLMELHSGFFSPSLPVFLQGGLLLPNSLFPPHSLVSLAKLNRVCFISSSRSLKKIINNIGSPVSQSSTHPTAPSPRKELIIYFSRRL